MMNKEQSAGTIAGQSTEAEVTNVSHNNGNTNVGCSLSDVSTGTKPQTWESKGDLTNEEYVKNAKEFLCDRMQVNDKTLITHLANSSQLSDLGKDVSKIRFSVLL